jgi:hypothetical protein
VECGAFEVVEIAGVFVWVQGLLEQLLVTRIGRRRRRLMALGFIVSTFVWKEVVYRDFLI